MSEPGPSGEPPPKLPWPLSAINVAQIRFSRGVVGKMSYVAASFVIGTAVVAYSCTEAQYKFYIVLTGASMFFAYMLAVLFFSYLNPTAALLEGADYVDMKRIELQVAAKDQQPVLPSANVAPPIAITSVNDGNGGSE